MPTTSPVLPLVALAALVLTGCGGDDGGSEDSAAVSSLPSTSAPAPFDGVLRIRPVLTPLAVDGLNLGLIGEDVTDDTVIAPEPATGLAYELGPSVIDETAVVEAEARQQGGAWSVRLTFTPTGQAAVEELVARCVARDPSCARGQVAITVDGQVLALPTVSPGLTGVELEIAGALSQEDAEALAEVLSP